MKRKVGLFLMLGAAVPLVVASAAWACGVLATLSLDKSVASPGQAITATGKNYSSSATASPVSIRLNTRGGKVVATTAPNSSNNINTTFSIPSSTSPGWYVVTATQFNADGTPKAGTPGRTTLRVEGAAGAASSARNRSSAAAWASSKPGNPSASVAGDGGGAGGRALLPLALVLSLSLLGVGVTLVGRRSRPTSRPPLGV